MTISPLPRQGDVVPGRDAAGRTMRVSAHPETGRVVLSIWQDQVCRGTLRLLPEDVPELLEMLARAAVGTSATSAASGCEADAG